MKYFEVSMEGLADSTFAEKLAALREAGKEAAEIFPLKYHALQEWFKKYDQPRLLAFAFYYFMTSPAGYDEEAVTGTLEFPPHYLELLQAFALTLPRSYDLQPFSEEVYKFKEDLKTVGELNKLKHFHFPDTIKTPEDLPFHLLRTEMMLHTTAVRNWSYNHLMKKTTLDLASLVRQDFTAHHGFDPATFLEVIYKMNEEVEVRINQHRLRTIAFMQPNHYSQVMDVYEETFALDKTTTGQRREIWERAGKNLKALKAMFLMHSDLFLEDIFSFDYKTLADYSEGRLTADQLKDIFASISLDFGDLANHNAEHFILSNPIHEKPFIQLSEDTVFCTLWTVMTHLSISLLEGFCVKQEKLKKKYNEVRAAYLEKEVATVFKTAFPMAHIYAGSKWTGKDGKEYENDLLVLIDTFALVVEAKAGQVSPSAKRGAPDRLFRTLRELIEEPSEQALRFIEFLKENPTELSLKVRKGPINKINAAPLKYFIPLGVTLTHLGMTGSNLKQLIKAGVTDKPIEELATSISLTDLQIAFDLLPLAAEKVHYLQRRRELEASVQYSGDELDLLAWYLDTGFNLGPDQEHFGFFKMDMKAKELDNYIIGTARNEVVVKPELKKTIWWMDILQRLQDRQPQTWLESSYIMLNLSWESQERFAILVDDMKAKILNGTTEYLHNWILMKTTEQDHQFIIAGYGYHEHLNETRNDIIGDILYDKTIENTKGKLVIGLNVDKPHYPYNVLGCWLSSDLFDNRFLKMLRDPRNN